MYKHFLEKLTPNDWKEEKMKKRKERQRLKKEAMVGVDLIFIKSIFEYLLALVLVV